MAYNLTNLTESGSLMGLFQTANVVTGGWFGYMIVISVWTIAFISLMQVSELKKAFATSSFVTFVITLMLRTTSLITNDYVLIAVFCLMGLGVGLLFASD